jgi:hypothetical protein
MSKLVQDISATAFVDPVIAVPVNQPPVIDNAVPQAQQTTMIDEYHLREFLGQHRWTVSMQDFFLDYVKKNPYKFFLYDDSGSMVSNDGRKAVPGREALTYDLVRCSRWEELSQMIQFQVTLCQRGLIPAEFVFLNRRSFIPGPDGTSEADFVRNYITPLPQGGTPLCSKLGYIISRIRNLEAELRATGSVATVVIATDGESTDGDIRPVMAEFKNLPVHVVLRLCTDESKIVDYWNSIDKELELNLDVVDDLVSEAEEVRTHNPWFTYSLELHEFREFGVTSRDIDMLDEQTLTTTAQQRIISLVYGDTIRSLHVVYCPIKKRLVECISSAHSASTDPSYTPINRDQRTSTDNDRRSSTSSATGTHHEKHSGGCVIC